MTDGQLNEREAEEAVRRALYGGGLESDDEIQQALDAAVEAGLMERNGDNYRLTEQGNAQAEATMKGLLDAPPPRAEADAHLYSVLQSMADNDEALQTAFALGQHVLQVEHTRLAERIAQFSDEWAAPLADLLRRGQL